jgi:hypothetical protein
MLSPPDRISIIAYGIKEQGVEVEGIHRMKRTTGEPPPDKAKTDLGKRVCRHHILISEIQVFS